MQIDYKPILYTHFGKHNTAGTSCRLALHDFPEANFMQYSPKYDLVKRHDMVSIK